MLGLFILLITLENIAIPYKNNPAYIDRITVTRRTIQNGSIIVIDYKDVSDVDPNQDANDSEYCVWFANDRVDESINDYTTKIAILNRKGFREFEDKIVQVPMKNPFDDSNTPYVNCSIRQLYQSNLIKKTGYSNEEIIATYDYPHQTNFSRYKPGIVLAKG